MADSQTKEPTKDAKEKEPTYAVSQLIEESRALLGVSRHVAIGALHGLKDGSTLSRDQAQARVKKFLGRKAQEAPES